MLKGFYTPSSFAISAGRIRIKGCSLSGGILPSMAWAIASSLNAAHSDAAGCGAVNSALVFAGLGALSSMEIYNGTTWAVGSASLNTGRTRPAGCGTPSAALVDGGTDAGGIYLASSELYNGVTWALTGNLNTGRWGHGGCGVVSAALAFGGAYRDAYPDYLSSAESFNGAVWSPISSLNTQRKGMAACGVLTSALAIAGLCYVGGTGVIVASVELYNGVLWTTLSAALNTAREAPAGCGVFSAALVYGGAGGIGPVNLISTESFNGTIWYILPSVLNVARSFHTACGTRSGAFAISGAYGSTYLISTEIYCLVHPPVAGFHGNPLSGTVPIAVQFTDTSAGTFLLSWSWVFGDGGTSTSQNPSHTYSAGGIYDVSLTVTNPLGHSTFTQRSYVNVLGPPVASFTGVPTSGSVPFMVQFTDTSTGHPAITTWLWDFGDGNTSGDKSPSHIYADVGLYTVSLTVTNVIGSNTHTEINYITAGNFPVASFTGVPTSGFSPLLVQFTDTSTGYPAITTWLWDFGDGSISYEQNPSHIYVYVGSGFYTVSLTVTNVLGSNTHTATNYIQVSAVVGSWALVGSLVTARMLAAACGVADAALVVSGADLSYSNIASSESYNGSAWSVVASANVPRDSHLCCGILTAALIAGGMHEADSSVLDSAESYDGSVWSVLSATLNTGRLDAAGCGTSIAALAIGGVDSSYNILSSVELYNGVLWTTLLVALNTARYACAACGVATAALAIGGKDSGWQDLSSVESYDGVSWSILSAALSTGRCFHSASGTVSSALAAAGAVSSDMVPIDSSEVYNGVAWLYTAGSLNVARKNHGGCGTSSSALAIGGQDIDGTLLGSTELFTGS